jgi:tetratricopeptide (TPR) repeat protein
MRGHNSFEVRLELAQGHWKIGEYEEALQCLERALEDASGDPQDPRLAELASQLANDLTYHAGSDASQELRTRLYRVVEAASEVEELSGSIATPTLAELLAEQGYSEKALRVAQDVLRKNPDDQRAWAVRDRLQAGGPLAEAGDRPSRPAGADTVIEELERWLGNLRRRGAEEVARA